MKREERGRSFARPVLILAGPYACQIGSSALIVVPGQNSKAVVTAMKGRDRRCGGTVSLWPISHEYCMGAFMSSATAPNNQSPSSFCSGTMGELAFCGQLLSPFSDCKHTRQAVGNGE
jgi:hypothetical protein